MRKGISSLFVLLLLLISLWGFSAWSFGASTRDSLSNVFSDQVSGNDILFTDPFEYELLDLSHSVFGAKAKIAIQVSSNGLLSIIGSQIDKKLILNVDIYNGPLLFDRSGISTGSSIWYVSIDEELNDKNLLNKLQLKQLPKAVIKIDFDNMIHYKLPIKAHILEMVVQGSYDPKTQENFGQIDVDNFTHQSEQQRIETKNAHLSFKHFNSAEKENVIDFSTDMPEILFQHQLMSKPINLKAIGNGKVSIHNNNLSVITTTTFEQSQTLNYPIEQGDLKFEITDVNLTKLTEVFTGLSTLENLQQQIGWILEEHAEVPEGQDQIWQMQDSIQQLSAYLPSLTNELMIKKNKAITRFTLNTQHQNKLSTLTGGILPLSQQSLDKIGINANTTFLSLFKAEAKINLDESLFAHIATQLPIKNPIFGLVYKQNKLLMQ